MPSVEDQILTDITVATLNDDRGPYGLIDDASIVIQADRIAWVGPRSELPGDYAGLAETALDGRLVTPGLIDCHTHIVHGGNRASEFELRLNGASYEDVARAGGGIISTVAATRAASEAALIASALIRVDAMLTEGATTIEIKSGYGLDTQTELRMLRAARAIWAGENAMPSQKPSTASTSPSAWAARKAGMQTSSI